MNRKSLSLLSLGALLTSGVLIAPQVFAHGPGHFFHKFDSNQDGKVTRSEVHEKVLKRFNEADKNNDKAVTREEAKKHHEAKRQEMRDPQKRIDAKFKAHDKNKNGKIERSESQLPDKIFNRLDKNGDGAITKAEALAVHEERRARRGARGPKDKKGHSKKGGTDGKSRFDRIDTSGDGKITEGEAKGAADRVFSRVDKNKDNVVTPDEAAQMRKNHRSGHRGKGHSKKNK